MATREKEGGKRTANQDVGLASKSSGSRQEAGEAMLQEDAPAGPNSHPKEMKVADKARTSKLRKMRENQAGATSPNTKKLMCQTPREEERANNDGAAVRRINFENRQEGSISKNLGVMQAEKQLIQMATTLQVATPPGMSQNTQSGASNQQQPEVDNMEDDQSEVPQLVEEEPMRA